MSTNDSIKMRNETGNIRKNIDNKKIVCDSLNFIYDFDEVKNDTLNNGARLLNFHTKLCLKFLLIFRFIFYCESRLSDDKINDYVACAHELSQFWLFFSSHPSVGSNSESLLLVPHQKKKKRSNDKRKITFRNGIWIANRFENEPEATSIVRSFNSTKIY